MFHDIPSPIRERMVYLEALDAQDRKDGTPHLKRLRQIPPQTGQFLALLLANAPQGQVLEIGTSAGYSGLWLCLACQVRGDTFVTFEVLPEKAHLAAETFDLAKVSHLSQVVLADARLRLPDYQKIAFCFLDAEKDIYQDCFDLVIPRLVRGGLLLADNASSHPELQPFIHKALTDSRVDALVVPIGKGLLLCRKI
jgi:caffeoyl-CoA O-methyltransferase